MPINILLAINPPQLPTKTKSYGKAESPPPLPLKHNSQNKEDVLPQLPLKNNKYVINRQNEVLKVQSIVHHDVKSYNVGGKQLFECDEKLFHNYEEAFEYCQIANNYEASKFGKNHWHSKQSYSFRRKSLSRSNSDLTNRINSNSRLSGFSVGGKNSLSGSRNSLSGLSRSSSTQSLTKSKNRLSLRRSSVLGSNNDVWVRRHSASETTSNFSSRRDSLNGSTKNLSLRKNSISGLTDNLSEKRRGSLSRRRGSLSNSKENLENNALDDEKSKGYLDKYMDKKPKSHQIWINVWSHCDVKCYSKKYYDKFKSLVLIEMNLYRQLHKAIPLVLNPKLDAIAQELADEYA